MGIFVSVTASILFHSLVGVGVVFQWATGEALTFDFSTGLHASVLFGGCAACLITAAINHSDARSSQNAARQIGAIVLGLLISIPLVAAVIFLVLSTTAGRQSGALHGGWIIWTMALPPFILSILTAFTKTKKIRRCLLPAVFCLIVFSIGFGDIGYEYDKSVGGFSLLSAHLSVIISTYCMLTFFSSVLVKPFVGDLASAITGAASGLTIHIGLSASFTYYPLYENISLTILIILLAIFFKHSWSLISYPFQAAWNRYVMELDLRNSGSHRNLPKHSLCWDEIQYLPFFELDEYLIASSEKNEDGGDSYFRFVNKSNQQWAVQSALTELDARRLESLPDIKSLATTKNHDTAGLLPTSTGLILRSFSQFSRDISAAISQPSSFNQVLVLRTVVQDIEQLQLELNRNYKDKIASRYSNVAEHWRKVVVEHTSLIDKKRENNNEIPNPYIVGAPLTRRQKIFVGRTDIARFLEDILKLQDRPPLLLYGPRRMGKTSLLYQLQWMLPRNILTLVVDLQGPVGLAQGHSGFVFALTRAMTRAASRANIQLTTLLRPDLQEDPFIKFDEWLNVIEIEMAEQGCKTLLLALDEFEALDTALQNGMLQDHAVLGMLRHIGQHRINIKLMLVGSHTLGEFKRWSSYFVNAQVIELSYLSDIETKILIEQPIANYPLVFHHDASERIFSFTRGHPYLVQLLCAELVAYKNSQPNEERRLATIKDVELCFSITLERGQQFFTDIELNQADELGRKCLNLIAKAGAQGETRYTLQRLLPALREANTLSLLQHRSIIEPIDDRYVFQVEAFAHWFLSKSDSG